MRLFALHGSQLLGNAIAESIGVVLDPLEERDFEDGEHKTRPMISVRGEDVYVVHSLQGDAKETANDKLCKLLFFMAACREHGAARLTAVVPYLAYSRKDRQTKTRDPVTTRYVAQLFEAVGADAVVVVDVHNIAAFQNAFRCRTVHLDTRKLFLPVMQSHARSDRVTVFSPDGGGVKRAQLLKEAYEDATGAAVGFGFMEKRRSGGVVSGSLFAGDVDGGAVFIVDDMISTGGTMLRAAEACRERGAKSVHVLATHGLFADGIEQLLESKAVDRTIVTDSVAPFRLSEAQRTGHVDVVSIAPLLGETVMRLHGNGSISRLLDPKS
jgi:ribose-phosphate pyrophosphokinase